MKWHEAHSDGFDSFFNVELEGQDGGFQSRGTFSSLEKAQREGERLTKFYGTGYKIRIYETPKTVWRNWTR